jgi:hypothetical protein
VFPEDGIYLAPAWAFAAGPLLVKRFGAMIFRSMGKCKPSRPAAPNTCQMQRLSMVYKGNDAIPDRPPWLTTKRGIDMRSKHGVSWLRRWGMHLLVSDALAAALSYCFTLPGDNLMRVIGNHSPLVC